MNVHNNDPSSFRRFRFGGLTALESPLPQTAETASRRKLEKDKIERDGRPSVFCDDVVRAPQRVEHMVKWHSSRDGARQPCVVRSAVARRLSHGAPLSADWHHRCRVALPRATLDKQSKSSGCSEERRRLAWPCRADNGIRLSPAACHDPMRRRAAPRRLVPRPSRFRSFRSFRSFCSFGRTSS